MITLLKLMPYAGAGVAPSPNHDVRKSPTIEGIILHATADAGNEAGTLSWLLSPKSKVSCHLFVSRSGDVTRLVGDRDRAWHAGRSWWRGTSDVNSITLGIEIANRNDGEPYTDAQYGRVAEVVAHYCRQGISLDDVVSHGAIAEDRRTDPLGWDWDRFREMVQDQLRAAGVECASWLTYDRRSGERVAAEVVAVTHSANGVAPAALKPRVTSRVTPRPSAPAIPTGKPILCSRTFWINALTVLAAASVIVGESLDLAYSVGLSVPEEITMWILFCVGVVNILLRYQTTCPIGNSQAGERSPPASVRVPSRPSGSAKGTRAPGPP